MKEISDRITELTWLKKETLNEYVNEQSEVLRSVLAERNMRLSMEITFLKKVETIYVLTPSTKNPDPSEINKVFEWLLGLGKDFPERKSSDGIFWWRPPLRRKLMSIGITIKNPKP